MTKGKRSKKPESLALKKEERRLTAFGWICSLVKIRGFKAPWTKKRK